MDVKIGDKLQYRGERVCTVTYVTDQTVLAIDDTGYEQAIGKFYLDEGAWEINGVRVHPELAGLYVTSNNAQPLYAASTVQKAWDDVDSRKGGDVVQIKADGTWTFVNRKGEPVE